MPDSIKRRDFIKKTSLLGASIAIADSFAVAAIPGGDNDSEVKNEYFRVSFDKRKRTINIYRSNETPLITGGTVCANSNIGKHSIASGVYKHTLDSTTFRDQLGSGKKIIINSKDRDKKLDFEIQVSLYDNVQAFTLEAICRNVSKHDLIIYSTEPVRVIKDEDGTLSVPGVSKCITNGAMYYNAGTVHEFGTYYPATPTDIKEVKRCNNSITSPNETVNSWWNAGLFSGYDKEDVVLGYLGNKSGLGQLLISKTAQEEISFLAETVYDEEIVLRPGKTVSSDSFMINTAADPYTALEAYAGAVGKINNARTQSTINGWCSWFYTLAEVSEDEVIKNAAFAGRGK